MLPTLPATSRALPLGVDFQGQPGDLSLSRILGKEACSLGKVPWLLFCLFSFIKNTKVMMNP